VYYHCFECACTKWGEKRWFKRQFLWGIRAGFFFIIFHKYHMKILLGDFNAILGREDVFKPMFGNDSLQQDIDDNGVRIVNFATSENLVKSTMFPHRNLHKYTWTSSDGKTHEQIDHTLIDSRWHSGILDVRSFRWATVILIINWWLQMLGNDWQ